MRRSARCSERGISPSVRSQEPVAGLGAGAPVFASIRGSGRGSVLGGFTALTAGFWSGALPGGAGTDAESAEGVTGAGVAPEFGAEGWEWFPDKSAGMISTASRTSTAAPAPTMIHGFFQK